MLQCTITRGGEEGGKGVSAWLEKLKLPTGCHFGYRALWRGCMYTRVVERKSAASQSRTLCYRTPQAFFLIRSKTTRAGRRSMYRFQQTKLAVGTGRNATQLDDATSQQRPFPVLERKKVPMKNHRCGGAVNLQTLATKLLGGGGKQWGRGGAKGTSTKKVVCLDIGGQPIQLHPLAAASGASVWHAATTILHVPLTGNSMINRAHLWAKPS